MAQHIGVDIVEIARIERAVARWGAHFLDRIFTESELKLYRERPWSLAARFACKEAVMKLLGTGWMGLKWQDIETLSRPGGRPFINLYGRAQIEADKLWVKELAVSLTHSKEYAIAYVAGASADTPLA